MKTKIKYLYYEAGPIEAVSSKEMSSWRNEVTTKLASKDAYAYDPVAQESQKVGKPSGEQVKYITGLKQSGHWDLFLEAMHKIWFADIVPDENCLIDTFKAMRTKSILEGNYIEDLPLYGDYEAVCRSAFLVIYWPKDCKTVGTVYEIFLAMLLQIPMYLILDGIAKTDCNSSLIYAIMLSGGEMFYSVTEATNYIKEKYKLTPLPEPKKE